MRGWQHWHFLVYVSALMTAGVATAKDEKYKGMVEYKRTTRILEYWKANMKYQKRKTIAEKLASHSLISTKRAVKDVLPYMQFALRSNKSFSAQFQHELDLSSEEMEWLVK